jgi:hypothetical protein
MSEANEHSESTQQEAGATQANAEREADAHQQTNTTARSAEATQSVSRLENPCGQRPCDPIGSTLRDCPPCTLPDQAAILQQYAVLTAILGSPEKGFFDLSTEIIVGVTEDGKETTGRVIQDDGKINFPVSTKTFACNFFAPMPPSAPVKWPFPTPQPLGLPSCLTPCQGCLEEKCDPCGQSLQFREMSSVSQHPMAHNYGGSTSG